MRKVKQDRCEHKPRKCCGVLKAVFGVGLFCAVLHAVHTWLEAVREQNADFEDYQN